jgi:hypothetical protein
LTRFGGHLSQEGYDVLTDRRHAQTTVMWQFSDQFKASAVRLVLDEGTTTADARVISTRGQVYELLPRVPSPGSDVSIDTL